MKRRKTFMINLLMIIGILSLSGCGFTDSNKTESQSRETNVSSRQPSDKVKYKKGDKIILLTHHMKGMYEAKGTINSVKKTKYYSVNYYPTNNPQKLVKNHKWVIEDEIKGKKPFKTGEKVILLAKHMKGMYGAKAIIDSVHSGYIYSVNYYPTNDPGNLVKDHKWVAGNEIEKAK